MRAQGVHKQVSKDLVLQNLPYVCKDTTTINLLTSEMLRHQAPITCRTYKDKSSGSKWILKFALQEIME